MKNKVFTEPILKNTESLGFFEMLAPPEDISVNGHLIDYLFNYTTTLNLVFFILVCIGLFGFSYLYHQKRHPKPNHETQEKNRTKFLRAEAATGSYQHFD